MDGTALCGEQTGKITYCTVGKDARRDSHILEWWIDGQQLLSKLVVAL